MHKEQVLKQMREMRLSVMAESFSESIRSGDSEELSQEEFVAMLIEDEYNARKNRKLSRMISRANFRPEKPSLENLRYSSARGLNKKDIKRYSNSNWIEDGHTLLLSGATGTGKTYLAEAIGLRACILGYPVLKIRHRKLLDDITQARGTGTYPKFLSMLEKIRVLIVDDFLITAMDKRECAHFLEILEEREQRGALIITSQYPTDQWHERLSDPTMADAICDRLFHGAHILNLGGPSQRRISKREQSGQEPEEK
jgi:DNA replication protein DnaC